MTQITYDIVRRDGSWRVACGKVVGPPYYRKQEAISDVNFVAESLRRSGDDVVVLIEGMDITKVTRQ